MFGFIETQNRIEDSILELERTKQILSVSADGLFSENELGEYYQQYEALIDAAIDKIARQIEELDAVSASLSFFGR